ncbi:hypothetical protein [Nocardioides ochotonae]|uniref:hypothetical protein n=1 Tax=Nocardioides ochotonae TaxID=2685869 RepID=UPI00140B7F5A|nr:hypothetical protein [Nocardioides ochotonae]
MTTDLFTFEHDGETYTFERPLDVVRTPGWLRANRRRDELDLAFTILEAVAGDEALEVIDNMTPAQFEALATRLHEAINASFR